MRACLAMLCAALGWGITAQAQFLPSAALDTARTFRSLERALKHDGPVYRLDLSRSKLKEVPEELRRLPHLNALDLSNNRLRDLPDWFGDLQYLQELRLSRNKLVVFPHVICKLRHLKRLDMARNALNGLPECMGNLKELVSLDLWSNDLVDLPEEIGGMESLRFLDLRVIQFEQPDMDRIQELLPRTKIWFSPPCNCGM
ncbi:MAG: leucine-rich repeat domain-containing protein [Flavobacteriales bacterium]|nr:leucine-rich repeat domain-containing protein [Flavobacteriales bacterium]